MADALLSLLGPFFVRQGLDQGVAAHDLGRLWLTTVLFAVSVCIDWAVTWGYTWITGRTSERMLFALRIKIFSHLQSLSLDYYDTELDGRVMTRMTTDVDALSQLVQTGLINALVGVLTCVGVFVFLVVLSPPLALAASSVLPPLFLATWWYRRRSTIAYAAARESIADVNANLQESLSGVRVAQAYVREDRNISGFHDVNRRYLTDRLGAQRLIAIYFPFVLFVADIGAVIVLATGNHLVQTGAVTTGVVIAFLLYLDQFFAPIQQLSQVLDTWQQAAASTSKIEELFTIPSGTPPPDHPFDPGRIVGEIQFDDVHFRYPNTVGDEALVGHRPDDRARARRWRWSVRRARASRRSSSWSVGSTTRSGEPCVSTGSTYARSSSARSDGRSASCRRRRSCSPGPSGTTSRTAAPTRPTPRSRPRRARSGRTTSSPRNRRGTSRR